MIILLLRFSAHIQNVGVIPFIYRYLTEQYTWRGCLLLTSGFIMQTSIFSLLLTSPLFQRNNTTKLQAPHRVPSPSPVLKPSTSRGGSIDTGSVGGHVLQESDLNPTDDSKTEQDDGVVVANDDGGLVSIRRECYGLESTGRDLDHIHSPMKQSDCDGSEIPRPKTNLSDGDPTAAVNSDGGSNSVEHQTALHQESIHQSHQQRNELCVASVTESLGFRSDQLSCQPVAEAVPRENHAIQNGETRHSMSVNTDGNVSRDKMTSCSTGKPNMDDTDASAVGKNHETAVCQDAEMEYNKKDVRIPLLTHRGNTELSGPNRTRTSDKSTKGDASTTKYESSILLKEDNLKRKKSTVVRLKDDIRFLRDPLYLSVLTSSVLTLGIVVCFVFLVLDFADHRGWTVQDGVLLNFIFMLSTLICRASLGVVSLYQRVTSVALLGITGVVGGVGVSLVGQVGLYID